MCRNQNYHFLLIEIVRFQAQLSKINRFAEKFPTIASMAQMSANGDTIGSMSGIGAQRSILPAKYTFKSDQLNLI